MTTGGTKLAAIQLLLSHTAVPIVNVLPTPTPHPSRITAEGLWELEGSKSFYV